MRKIFAVILTAATLLSLLSGCGGVATEIEPTTAPMRSGLSLDEVLNNLEEMLEPIKDQFQMTRLPKVELEEGKSYQSTAVTDTLFGNSYYIRVYCDKAGDVEWVWVEAKRDKYTELNFAILSYYTYLSMKMPKMEADDFYDHFNLLTENPRGELSVDRWSISVNTSLTGDLTFFAKYTTD